MKKFFIVILLILLVVILFIFLKKDKWTLSLYKDGETISRTILKSLEACSMTGTGYVSQGSADKFDCSLGCEKSNDLSVGIICKKVIR